MQFETTLDLMDYLVDNHGFKYKRDGRIPNSCNWDTVVYNGDVYIGDDYPYTFSVVISSGRGNDPIHLQDVNKRGINWLLNKYFDQNTFANETPPSHLVETGDFEPITKENILEVLAHNNITDWQLRGGMLEGRGWLLAFDQDGKWLKHLEVEVGKLKPLSKKKETLLTWWSEQTEYPNFYLGDAGGWGYELKANNPNHEFVEEEITLIRKEWTLENQIQFTKDVMAAWNRAWQE